MARHARLRSSRSVRKERRKAVRTVLFFMTLAFIAVGGLVYVFSRPEFRITAIEVNGSARVPKRLLHSRIVQEISGTYIGFIPKSHTLFYPKSVIKETLLKEFPAFSSVSLSLRNLSALRASVREREPIALWCASECFFLDESGFAFAKPDEGAEPLYYRLESAATSSPLGTTAIGKERLASLLSFLKQLEKLSFNPERTALRGAGELEVALEDEVKILAREGDYERALGSLQALLDTDALPRTGDALAVSYIDVRYGNKIYFKPK